VINITNEDNMAMMARYTDNHFDLAIVDPPYGIGEAAGKNASRNKGFGIGNKKSKKVTFSKDYGNKSWDDKCPNKQYFIELKRVSKNQIIFGANHFIENIPAANSSCWIVWDKDNGESDFADSELAYASFKTAVRNYKFRWNGMLQQDMKNKQVRIHPTEKPVKLYEWLLINYAKEGDKILDTHGGSLSIALAVHNVKQIDKMDLTLDVCELDTDYFNDGVNRYNNHIKQLTIF